MRDRADAGGPTAPGAFRAPHEASGLDVFVPVEGEVDVRALLLARGETIESGLSVIDGDLLIAGLGVVDLVAIDAQRCLVVVDLAGPGEASLEGRPLAHARWFRENLQIVRRMYQLWNVRWELPTRTVWVVPKTEAEAREGGGGNGTRADEIERIAVRLARTREGREALFLQPLSARRSAATPAAPARLAASDSAVAAAVAAAPAATPAAAPAATERRDGPQLATGNRPLDAQTEAYRRELGLSREELAEFFTDPASPMRRGRGGGA